MDIILLGITVVSLIVAFIMSVTAMRLSRDEKKRSAARVAALSVDASDASSEPVAVETAVPETSASALTEFHTEQPAKKAPWSPPREEPEPDATVVTHASGFLGANAIERDNGGRQRTLAIAAIALFVLLSGGLAWMMSGPRGTTAQAMGPNAPLELVSLTHQRENSKLAVSGLVRNPDAGRPIERLSAVVFLFDRTGTFVSSSRANVDFLRLGAGDESPFVVSLDAPKTVARYRVSFRTDDGVVPHIDRRSASPAPADGEQTLNVSAK